MIVRKRLRDFTSLVGLDGSPFSLKNDLSGGD